MEESGIYDAASAALDMPSQGPKKGEASPSLLLGDVIELSPRQSLCCNGRLRGPSQTEIDRHGNQPICTICGRPFSYGEEQ